jgi:hypothetical protein
MEIEDTIKRQSYRDFDLVQLRQVNATKTRWHISHQESGMNRSYGFVTTESEAQSRIDALLKRRSEGREPEVLN